MKKYFLILFLLICLISPVVAQRHFYLAEEQLRFPDGYNTVSHVQPSDMLINTINGTESFVIDYPEHDYVIINSFIFQPISSIAQFTVKTYNDVEISGTSTIESTWVPFIYNHTITFAGESFSANEFITPFLNQGLMTKISPVYTNVSSNMSDAIPGILIYGGWFTNDKYIFYQYDIVSDPIQGIGFYCNALNTQYEVRSIDLDTYYENLIGNVLASYSALAGLIIDLLWGILDFVYNLITYVVLILQNLPMFIALGEVISMAVALFSSSNIFTAIKKWWRFNEYVIEFVSKILYYIFQALESIKNLIPGLRWL